jgi:hypothetical protein
LGRGIFLKAIISTFFLFSRRFTQMNADMLKYKETTNIEAGLLLNFGRKPEFKRFVYDNKRKNISDDQRRSAASKYQNS